MTLMERVTTLLRANMHDLVDRAEDPEKMMKQLLADMDNQLLQVKTQVAMAIADQHLLEKRAAEEADAHHLWERRAEKALAGGDETLARLALERVLSHAETDARFRQQVTEQRAEAENLRATYLKLQDKVAATRAQFELEKASRRRAVLANKIAKAQGQLASETGARKALGKMRTQTEILESKTVATRAVAGGEPLEERFATMEREDKVENLLAEMKLRQLSAG